MPHANRVSVANSLLAALPSMDYQRLLTSLEPVTLTFGEVLYHPSEPIQHVYFPTDSLVSLLTLVEGHMALEIGLVGREGMLGIPVALGINDSPVRALVQGTGTALRMTAARFRSEYGECGPLHRELNRYIHERIVQITQTAACNRFHPVEARLARWLLMTRDRMQSDQFRLTQDLLGSMLGVLRVAVTKAAGDLQQRKLIRYRRGEISILDGQGLEAAACRCYQVVKNVHDRAPGGHSNRENALIAAVACDSDDEVQPKHPYGASTMSEDLNSKLGKTLDPFAGKRGAGTGRNPQSKATPDNFPGDFAKLKLSVIRPAFETVGNMLKERGHEINISEDTGGKISIHIVPAGVKKSIHPYDWYPTLSFFGAPFTRTVGLHGRNMRPNSEASSGSRGDYKPAQISQEIVEKELMKFVGEIANW